MPLIPILAALGEIVGLLRIGAGVASVIAGTAIAMASFAAFVGAFVSIKALLLSLLDAVPATGLCLATQLGAILDLQVMFGMIAAALSLRFTRFLALRAMAMANALSSRGPGGGS